jgi:transposase
VRADRPAAQSTAPAAWFAYSEDRKGEHPRRHLKDYSGALQADAYSGLHHLYGDGRIYEVACWAHARRKFRDIHVTHRSPITTEALNRIGALYAIEEQVRGKPPELRCTAPQAQAKPVLDDLRQWMEKMLRSLSAKSDTAGAIRYALSHWRALTRYIDNGLLEIDKAMVSYCTSLVGFSWAGIFRTLSGAGWLSTRQCFRAVRKGNGFGFREICEATSPLCANA